MANFRLYPKAFTDLEDIWLYGVQEWGVHQADRYLEDMNEAFSMLADNPLLANERIEFTPAVRIHPHRSHQIVYSVKEDAILIIRILHKSMLPSLHL